MFKAVLSPIIVLLFLNSPKGPEKFIKRNSNTQRQYIYCAPGEALTQEQLPRLRIPRLIYLDEKSAFPSIVANDNTVPAGNLNKKVLELQLEIVWSDFYPESNNRPGLRVITESTEIEILLSPKNG